MGEENNRLYYYHGDHLGSAQLVTDPEGKIYEQLEYTPYGELWVEHLETVIEATPFRFTGKERDGETGLYYFGARYLNPQTSMWLSADPAMGEYIPQAPINDEAKKQNQNLPGMGGVFNYVNLHAYHYAGNNPVKLVDPDGRDDEIYDLSGNHIRTVESDTNHVYVQKPNIRHGYDLVQLDVDVAEFNIMVTAVYGEAQANGPQEEANAIADVVKNVSDYRTLSLVETMTKAGVKGYTPENITAVESGMTSNNSAHLRKARAAAIDAFYGTIDSSLGSYFWEGLTFLTPGSPYYDPDNWYVQRGWGTTPGQTGEIHFLENTRLGGTVFMRNNPQYHGNRRHP
jgi:RHS repeat-associated protein